MESKKPRRAFKACVHCKSRKLKCDLGDPEAPGEPPCARCKRASRECVLSTPKERGPRTARAPTTSTTSTPNCMQPSSSASINIPRLTYPPLAGTPGFLGQPSLHTPGLGHPQPPPNYNTFPFPQPVRQASYHDNLNSGIGVGGSSTSRLDNGRVGTAQGGGGSSREVEMREGDEGDDTSDDEDGAEEQEGDVLLSSTLHNPGDAFRLLINAARPNATEESPLESLPERTDVLSAEELWARWALVTSGLLTIAEASNLLIFFETEMAPLYPILPPEVFRPEHLHALTSEESLLLAAMIAIAARHSPLMINGREEIHDGVSQWIRQQLVTLLDGSPRFRHVSTVEALLLLSEWPSIPHTDNATTPAPSSAYSPSQIDDQQAIKDFLQPSNVYDNMSWSYIGFSVRLAQELNLHNDAVYFESDATWMQERYLRTWLYAYNADRHVAIRLGRNASVQAYMTSSWWERVSSHHSKMASTGSGTVWTEEAFSQGLLAALMGTIQERLYPEKEVTRLLLKTGHWENFLRSLEQELKVIRRKTEKFLQQDTVHATLLHIEICYVHLYGNAIALRGLQERLKRRMKEPASYYSAPSLLNLAEGPWVLDALSAAQSTLQLAVTILEPKGYLRLCPSRIFLRILFAATFLFKALAVGVVEHGQSNILGLLSQTIGALERSSIDHDHIARGFALLLGRVQSQCHPTILSDPKPPTQPLVAPSPAVSHHPIDASSSWNVPQESTATDATDAMGLFSGLEAFDFPWEWNPPSAQALEAGRDQDLLFKALWSTDVGASNALGTLVGDGFGF